MTVPDKVVIAFFTAVTLAQSTAIIALWMKVNELQDKLITR